MWSFWWTHSLYSVVGTRLFRLFTDTQKHRGTERERDLQFFPHSSGSRQLPFYELPRFLTVFKVVGWCCVNLCDLYCCWSKQDKAELASPFFLFFCSASKMWAWFENGVGLNSSQELSGRKRKNLFFPLPFREGVKRWGNFFYPIFCIGKKPWGVLYYFGRFWCAVRNHQVHLGGFCQILLCWQVVLVLVLMLQPEKS